MPTYYGKTVEEAIEEGLKELGITAEQAEIKVIEEAKRDFGYQYQKGGSRSQRQKDRRRKSKGVFRRTFPDNERQRQM